MEDNFKKSQICDCECHGSESIMHCMPCCGFTYKRYVNEDGSIDIDQWSAIFNKVHGVLPTVIESGGKWYWIHK